MQSYIPLILAVVSTNALSQILLKHGMNTIGKFEFSGGDPWQINKKAFDINRIDADPKLGATEIWRVSTSKHHPIHLHLVQFKILDRKGGVRPTDVGWKDTMDLEPHQTGMVLARFTGYHGKYVFHCHNLEHEDMAMMGRFDIVD